MSRPRPQRATPTTTQMVAALAPSTPWRDLVDADTDLDAVAARLSRLARWTCVGDRTLDADAVPSPPAADLDAIDTWLLLADAGIDRSRYEGRRSWAWRQAMAD